MIANHTRVGNITVSSLEKNVSQFRKEVKAFKEKNKIRYSDRNPNARKTAATLARENKRLKEDVKYLRELVRLQKKVTNGTRMKRTDVENMAKLLMKK